MRLVSWHCPHSFMLNAISQLWSCCVYYSLAFDNNNISRPRLYHIMRPRTHLHQNGWPGQDQSVVSWSQHYSSSVTQQYNGNNISLPRSVAQRAIRGPLEGTKEIFCHPEDRPKSNNNNCTFAGHSSMVVKPSYLFGSCVLMERVIPFNWAPIAHSDN